MDDAKVPNDSYGRLRSLLLNRDTQFLTELREQSASASSFGQMAALSTLRKKAERAGLISGSASEKPLKIALIGGSTLFPISDLIVHLVTVTLGEVDLWSGEFNNYRAEIFDRSSALYEFGPDLVILLPDEKSCRYTGPLTDPKEIVESAIQSTSTELLDLCAAAKESAGAEILLCNFIPPSAYDIGPVQTKRLASEWNFKKAVNIQLGLNAPSYVHICDLEFLCYRLGGLNARDDRAWIESKQLLSPSFQVAAAKEIAHIVASLRTTPKKVLALDLDNTLWGGVIGDDGLEGIEIGDTSPRGEAFKAFQTYISSLTERGLLLAVCSKNDFEVAIEPFRKHPEMVLREEDFVSFKANWEPKAQNLMEMANELNLGLDSFIFVDDNPAEVENVRQFAPEVTSILLEADPSVYVNQLKESRLFERLTITGEDLRRTAQYREEAVRSSLREAAVDMNSYLKSLEMIGTIREFNSVDLPRIAQLINKSNQFNLTTRRRQEAELAQLLSDPSYTGFSMRLVDRFGDHGLISVVICKSNGDGKLEIDTWLMSCRVLKRQVEEQVLNEIARLAKARGCSSIKGEYIPTAKNSMVKDLYPDMGFEPLNGHDESGRSTFELSVETYTPRNTFISLS